MQTHSGTENALAVHVWERPECYMGYNPEGEYMIYAKTRGSSALDESNFECIKAALEKAATESGKPESIYTWTASHWACGWIEYLMVKPDAPQAVLDTAAEALEDLAQYPVYNEDDFTRREEETAAEVWAILSVRERAEMIQKYGQSEDSIFAARRDEVPHGGDIVAILNE